MRKAYGPMARFLWCVLIWANLAQAAEEPRFPLSTNGRYVVDGNGQRFKLRSANWHGFHHGVQVLQGLDKQPIEHIVGLLREWGFNSVRLPFSNQSIHDSNPVPDWAVAANPQLRGMTPLQIYDASVKALTDGGIAVVLNNHTTTTLWCCNYDTNGLWHNEGVNDFSQTSEQWVQDWLMMARRYRDNKMVVGADLRNEVRTGKWKNTVLPTFPNWGKDDGNDWHKAATDAGNRILAVNPDLLIVVEGINWNGTIPLLGSGERPTLKPVSDLPVNLNVPNKLVYAAHNYFFTGPHHTGDDKTSPGRVRYGQMDEATLRKTIDEEFGYVVNPDQYTTAPVWVSEFGVARDEGDPQNRAWFTYLVNYLIEKDMDFSYWPFNFEAFGLVSEDYSRNLYDDWRYPYLHSLLTMDEAQGPFKGDRFRRIATGNRDENLSSKTDDWMPYSRKGTCGNDERMIGLSQDHRALCFHQEGVDFAASQPAFKIEGKGETAARPHGIADWAPGSTKYECPLNYQAVGYANEKGRATGLLCASVDRALSTSCRALVIKDGDQRLSLRGGDWAYGSYKGQCRDQDYVAGYAHKGGKVQAILCCSLQ